MIPDLCIFTAVSIVVQEYSVNAVIGFDLVNDLIALRLEICVNRFIRTDINRIFEYQRQTPCTQLAVMTSVLTAVLIGADIADLCFMLSEICENVTE